MSEGSSLINFGDLSKPVTVLIEKVCDAVGIIYEPTRIKRKAKAEAAAAKVATLNQIELTELERRAMERLVHQEARKQANIEKITASAAASLTEEAKVNDLEADWVAHFFKRCDTVSDEEMQSLWSRLLAGEATTPGTFSKRTVDFIGSIDKKDAVLFTAFCQFVWTIGEPVPLIFQIEDPVFSAQGITFESLKHLDAIGLISLETVSGYAKKGFEKYAHAFYYGRPTTIEFSADEMNQLAIGHALLTSTGKELLSICGSARNEDFYEAIVRKWSADGLILSSVIAKH